MRLRTDLPLAAVSCGLALLATACEEPTTHSPRGLQEGRYVGHLDGPGGPIPFVLEATADGSVAVVDRNETVPLRMHLNPDQSIALRFDVDSQIELREGADGTWVGSWQLARGELPATEMPCSMARSIAPRFTPPADVLAGLAEPPLPLPERWRCTFSGTEGTAVGLFATTPHGRATGTFLTPLGDYRFLEGTWDGDTLVLACFDGAHAFRFVARLDGSGDLAGDFWSRDSWHETFVATPDPGATLADGFDASSFLPEYSLHALTFPDLNGRPRALDDPEFQGAARVLIVFGSWCPNCRDATRLWADWEKRYRSRGLKVQGLAFERSADLEHETDKLRDYVRRQGIEFPVLIAGLADKAKASEALPILDQVRAFPTTIFLDANDRAIAVHTGFTGPAAPEEHAALRGRFERLLETALSR